MKINKSRKAVTVVTEFETENLGLNALKMHFLNKVTRRVARNSRWGAVLVVWGRSLQLPEARRFGGGAPSARKFCNFLQK